MEKNKIDDLNQTFFSAIKQIIENTSNITRDSILP